MRRCANKHITLSDGDAERIQHAQMISSKVLYCLSAAIVFSIGSFDVGMRFFPNFNLTTWLARSASSASRAGANMTPLTTVELLTLDASALAKLLAEERITSVTLVKQVLAQIAQEDKAGAELNAIISVAPYETLIETAAKLDEERKQGKLRGPFHGIPILVKV